jgi:hypothetical protein
MPPDIAKSGAGVEGDVKSPLSWEDLEPCSSLTAVCCSRPFFMITLSFFKPSGPVNNSLSLFYFLNFSAGNQTQGLCMVGKALYFWTASPAFNFQYVQLWFLHTAARSLMPFSCFPFSSGFLLYLEQNVHSHVADKVLPGWACQPLSLIPDPSPLLPTDFSYITCFLFLSGPSV